MRRCAPTRVSAGGCSDCSARRPRSAITWSRTRAGWRLLDGALDLPDQGRAHRERCSTRSARQPEPGPDASAALLYRAQITGPAAVAALRMAYRDQLMLLAAADLAATVENEPVLPYLDGRGACSPTSPTRR